MELWKKGAAFMGQNEKAPAQGQGFLDKPKMKKLKLFFHVVFNFVLRSHESKY